MENTILSEMGPDFARQFNRIKKRFQNSYFQGVLRARTEPWLANDTVDSWRYQRMYSFIDPLIKLAPKTSWLTVGDGVYGKEAHYLAGYGVDVLATDIMDGLLKKAKHAHYIQKYKKENAEKLSFKENYFDYVLCKESYHHFPRPTVALYQMLRVVKKEVVLIEPNDVKTRGFSWKRFWSVDDPKTQANNFEISGNYVYSVSRREIEKVALGIGLPAIAFSGFDDIYNEKSGVEKIEDNTFGFRKIKAILWFLDILFKIGMRDRSLLVAVIFKEKPSPKMIKELKLFGYDVKLLPKNPYII